MTTAQSLFAGALLIASAILFTQSIKPAEAQYLSGGRYQLMHHSNTSANAGVFRLDTGTGEVSYCFLSTGTAQAELVCSKAVK
jgi:hypothetical protein